jgi:ferredoxin
MKRKLTTAFRRAMYPSADPQTEHDVAHEKIYNQRNIQSSAPEWHAWRSGYGKELVQERWIQNREIEGIIPAMAAEREIVKSAGMVPDELKHEPRSKGLTTPRKKKPKELAVITECCTGCAGSPACLEYCPVEDCMFWVPDENNPPFGRIDVDPILCIGCKKCVSKGPDGCFLDGCPWDAIVMVDIAEVEKVVGAMTF